MVDAVRGNIVCDRGVGIGSGSQQRVAARGIGPVHCAGWDRAGEASIMTGWYALLGLGLIDVLLGLWSRRRGSLRWKQTVLIGLVVMAGAVYGMLST